MREGIVRAFIWPYTQWPVMKVYALQILDPILGLIN